MEKKNKFKNIILLNEIIKLNKIINKKINSFSNIKIKI